jgi:hypothetical protein
MTSLPSATPSITTAFSFKISYCGHVFSDLKLVPMTAITALNSAAVVFFRRPSGKAGLTLLWFQDWSNHPNSWIQSRWVIFAFRLFGIRFLVLRFVLAFYQGV